MLTLAEAHHNHALRRAAGALDPIDCGSHDGAAIGDQHHLIALAHDPSTNEVALALDELRRLDAHRAAPLGRVLGDAGPLAPTVPCHDEQVGVVGGDIDLDYLVVASHLHSGYTRGGPAHRADVLLVEAHRLSKTRHHQDVVVTISETHADQLVVLAHLERNDPVGLERRVVLEELGLLDHTLLRREDQVLRLLVVTCGDHSAHELVLPEGQQVDDRTALRLA